MSTAIRPLNCFHSLVKIWSFECLQAIEEMSRKNSFEIEENECEYKKKCLLKFKTECFLVFHILLAIVRYLGSRFQETLAAVDEDNRTALHYAATIKDNGHFYNLLLHLGANPKSTDKV